MKRTKSILTSLLLIGLTSISFYGCKKATVVVISTVSTQSITSITQLTATSGGIIASEGGATVTSRGVCWSTSPTPTINDNKTTDGTGAGSFTSSITGLTANTTYYVRAYATNSTGTGYGSALSFTTNRSFKILDSLSNNKPAGVDFYKDSVQFSGKWSITTPWKITITGRTSGAVKTLTGNSNTIDTLSLGIWNGTADGIFFKNNELCDVKLTFGEDTNTMKSIIKILGLHDYTKDGIILADFETPITFNGSGHTTVNARANSLVVPEGSYYYNILGSEPGPPNSAWYIAGYIFTAKELANVNTIYFPYQDKDVATTYMNFFVYNYGYTNTKIDILLNQDDNGDGVHIGAGDISDTTKFESTWMYELNVTTIPVGWQKISVPFSNFPHAVTWDLTGEHHYGSKIMEISKIVSITLGFDDDGTIATPKIGCAVDFFIITTGKPL